VVRALGSFPVYFSQRLFSALGIAHLKALRVKYGTTEEDTTLVENQFEGLTSLTDLEIWNANANLGELKVHPKVIKVDGPVERQTGIS
jgi:hypothetical protein